MDFSTIIIKVAFRLSVHITEFTLQVYSQVKLVGNTNASGRLYASVAKSSPPPTDSTYSSMPGRGTLRSSVGQDKAVGVDKRRRPA